MAGKDSRGLRSRVSFSPLIATRSAQSNTKYTTVLSTPKPTFYPAYLEQKPGAPLITLMDKVVKLRGWKRYPVRQNFDVPASPKMPDGKKNKSESTLVPLDAGVVFNGSLRIHNLKPVELGALLWAVTWGGQKQYRHALGMGKPFGFGQVSIEMKSCNLLDNCGASIGLAECEAAMKDFEKFMSDSLEQDWRNSEPIRHLLAMADPTQAKGKNLAHMDMNSPTKPFTSVKTNQQSLAPYIGATK